MIIESGRNPSQKTARFLHWQPSTIKPSNDPYIHLALLAPTKSGSQVSAQSPGDLSTRVTRPSRARPRLTSSSMPQAKTFHSSLTTTPEVAHELVHVYNLSKWV